jgi:hypothetical protein
MAKVVTDQARGVALDRYGNISGPPAALQSGSVDDSAVVFGTGTTNLGNPVNLAAAAFDSISRAGNVLTVTFTLGTGVANFIHKRIAVHNAAAGAVTGASNTVQYGHDQQSVQKTNTTSISYSLQLQAS